MIIRLAYPRQFLVTISLVLWAVFLAACTPGDDVRARVDAAHDRNDAPPIWVVKDHNTELYLFGTVHLLPNELDWQKDDMKAVFDEAGTVFFELDSSPEALLETVLIMQQLGQQTKGRTISQKLDSYQLKLLEAVSHNGDIPIASLDSMTPWLASEFLTIAAADKAGLKADLSADEALKNRASRQKKNIVYLDDAETQIRASADLPSYVQMEMFIESMERFNSMGTELTNIANSWAKGDIDGLNRTGPARFPGVASLAKACRISRSGLMNKSVQIFCISG